MLPLALLSMKTSSNSGAEGCYGKKKLRTGRTKVYETKFSLNLILSPRLASDPAPRFVSRHYIRHFPPKEICQEEAYPTEERPVLAYILDLF